MSNAVKFYDRACAGGSKADCTRSYWLKKKETQDDEGIAASTPVAINPAFPRVVKNHGDTCTQTMDQDGTVIEECRDATGQKLPTQRYPNAAAAEPQQENAPAPSSEPSDSGEWRKNVLSVGASLSLAFLPDPTGTVFGYGFSVGYERALNGTVGLSFAAALSPSNSQVGFGLGLGLPIYAFGRAPSGLAITPSVSLLLTPIVAAAIGLTLGYQFVAENGLVLGVSSGPTLSFISGLTIVGIGAGVDVGYAF